MRRRQCELQKETLPEHQAVQERESYFLDITLWGCLHPCSRIAAGISRSDRIDFLIIIYHLIDPRKYGRSHLLGLLYN
jgi:hypothetical protein